MTLHPCRACEALGAICVLCEIRKHQDEERRAKLDWDRWREYRQATSRARPPKWAKALDR